MVVLTWGGGGDNTTPPWDDGDRVLREVADEQDAAELTRLLRILERLA